MIKGFLCPTKKDWADFAKKHKNDPDSSFYDPD